jgi:hydrogenase maturation protein HypF
MELKKIKLQFKVKKSVLALGSQTKNRACFLKGNFAYLGPTHAELNNLEDFLGFQECVKYLLKKNPKIIAYDLHPEYQSTKYALSLNAIRYTLLPIQHHHAHIVSCMAENGLKNQKVIGVAFDGTGLGVDNKLWGAEFLICNYKNFKRCAHLKEVPLLGQEKAILEPYRIALIWLYSIYKEKLFSLGIDFVKSIDKKNWRVLKNMYIYDFNSPLASSMGRLFDAAASLILAKYKANFEAELAIVLEKIASGCGSQVPGPGFKEACYGFRIIKNKEEYILDPLAMFEEIVKDLQQKEQKENIAYRFHLTVAQMIRRTCLILRNNTGINRVVLSGGVFQNNLLLNKSLDLLYRAGFKVYTHQNLTCNDSGISLGQAVIAATLRG